MSKAYCKFPKSASRSGRGSSRIVTREDIQADRVSVEVPVSLSEVIDGIGQSVEELAGEAGLRIMQALMESEVESLAGPKGTHEPDRPNSRWGGQGGYVVLAGKKVRVKRPRVRDVRNQEVPLGTYAQFQSPPRRSASIYRPLIHGISTRKYERAIERFTEGYGIKKSSISRSFIPAARKALKELCERRIDSLGRMVVLMLDGQHFAGECVMVALGVDESGKKHLLGLVQGATENAVAVQQLLDDLIERGLDVQQKRLIVIDGSKALRKAVNKTFGEDCAVQRCQLHKRRNVVELMPESHQRMTDQRLCAAYAMSHYADAKKALLASVEWLEDLNPTAAASLREGLEETLTLHRLGVPEALRKSLFSTNLIESALSVGRDLTRRVKHWRKGDMRLRWAAAALLSVEQRFRRVRGYASMCRLVQALEGTSAGLATKSNAA